VLQASRQYSNAGCPAYHNAVEGGFGAAAMSGTHLQVSKTQCTPHAVFVCAIALSRLVRSDLHSTIAVIGACKRGCDSKQHDSVFSTDQG